MAYRLLDAAGFWLPVAWVGLVVAALGLSTARRRTLGVLAYGSLVTVGLVGLALLLVQHRVVSLAPAADQRDVVEAMATTLLRGLRIGLRTLLLLAAATLLVRWVTSTDSSAVRARQLATSGVSAVRGASVTPVFRGAVVVVVTLLLVAWLI